MVIARTRCVHTSSTKSPCDKRETYGPSDAIIAQLSSKINLDNLNIIPKRLRLKF